MSTHTISVRTSGQTEFVEITDRIQNIITEDGVQEGIVLVYCPHTTAGLTINENADPHVQRDMVMELNKMVPMEDGYLHMEGNSAAHIKATLTGFSLNIPISRGRMTLGTWQGIYFCEFDGSRSRNVIVKILADR